MWPASTSLRRSSPEMGTHKSTTAMGTRKSITVTGRCRSIHVTGTSRICPAMGTHRRIPVTSVCSSIPVPWGCPDSHCSQPQGLCPKHGAEAGVALSHGTAALTPIRDLPRDVLLHISSALLPVSCASFPSTEPYSRGFWGCSRFIICVDSQCTGDAEPCHAMNPSHTL